MKVQDLVIASKATWTNSEGVEKRTYHTIGTVFTDNTGKTSIKRDLQPVEPSLWFESIMDRKQKK